MGQGYLIDSNVIIDFCNGKLPNYGRKLLESVVPEISIITHIELFANKNISQPEYALLEKFITVAVIYPVNIDLVETIDVRKEYKLKLPDAIIAATALVYKLTLISHNLSYFKNIKGLHVIDPYKQ